jgi:hypothetical protein
MTLLYLIVAGVVVWLLSRIFASKKSTKPGNSNNTYDIPIHVKVTDESDTKARNQDRDEDKDNWEGSFWEVQQPFPAKATLSLEYEDGAEKRTERVVDVRQFGTDVNGNILIGHCRMRNATRTFRTDRIKRCIDQDTGEIVGDVFAYLRKKYDSSPESARDALYEEEYDTLRVLLYVGKADGQLRAQEKVIVREACRSLANDSRITDAMIDEIFFSLEAPTLHAFKLAVGRLAEKEVTARNQLIKVAEDMVATQKTVHPAEKEALEYMRKKLLEPGLVADKSTATPVLQEKQREEATPLL